MHQHTIDFIGSSNGRTFDGATFNPSRDGIRLTHQLAAVHNLMADGRERTLAAIASAVGSSEASASARLRDLRKAKFGGHTVQRRCLGGGLHAYRVAAGQA